MIFILGLLNTSWMSFLAAAAGGNAGASWLVQTVGTRFGAFWGSAASRLPEIVWAISIAIVSTLAFGLGWYGLLIAVAAYFAMETGHGNAYHMGTLQTQYAPRHQTLDYIVLPVCRLFDWANRSAPYCWLFMGLKGLLIGLPLGMYGIPLAILWPLAYWISFTKTKSSELAEYMAGAFTGLLIALAIIMSIK